MGLVLFHDVSLVLFFVFFKYICLFVIVPLSACVVVLEKKRSGRYHNSQPKLTKICKQDLFLFQPGASR